MVMAHYIVYSAHDPVALTAAVESVAAQLPVGRVEVYARQNGCHGGTLGITVHDVPWPEWCVRMQCTFITALAAHFVDLRLSQAVARN